MPAPRSGVTVLPDAVPRIVVAPDSALIDEPLAVRVDGLRPGTSARIRASFQDDLGQSWSSEALLVANPDGEIDLDLMSPTSGSYSLPEAVALLWSMEVDGQSSASLPAVSEPTLSLRPLRVTFGVEVGEQRVAETAVVRQLLAPTVRRTDVREGGLVGTLLVPAGPGPHPAALVVTGSSGGFAWAQQVAALLASRGRSALALAYFDWQGRDGLPTALSEIPLEYFSAGIDRLLAEPSVRPDDLAAMGISKGGELVLLLAAADPRIDRVVAYAPSSVVWQAVLPGPAESPRSSWSRRGEPLPFVPAEPDLEFYRTYDRRRLGPIHEAALADSRGAARAAIPVERIDGPVLLISGSADEVWPSKIMADQVMRRRAAAGPHPDDRHLSFDGMGHVFGIPYLPTSAFGEDRPLAAHAERDAWRAVRTFLGLEGIKR